MQIRILLVRFHEASCIIITPDSFPPGNETVILHFLLEDSCVLGIVLGRVFVYDMGYQW